MGKVKKRKTKQTAKDAVPDAPKLSRKENQETKAKKKDKKKEVKFKPSTGISRTLILPSIVAVLLAVAVFLIVSPARKPHTHVPYFRVVTEEEANVLTKEENVNSNGLAAQSMPSDNQDITDKTTEHPLSSKAGEGDTAIKRRAMDTRELENNQENRLKEVTMDDKQNIPDALTNITPTLKAEVSENILKRESPMKEEDSTSSKNSPKLSFSMSKDEKIDKDQQIPVDTNLKFEKEYSEHTQSDDVSDLSNFSEEVVFQHDSNVDENEEQTPFVKEKEEAREDETKIVSDNERKSSANFTFNITDSHEEKYDESDEKQNTSADDIKNMKNDNLDAKTNFVETTILKTKSHVKEGKQYVSDQNDVNEVSDEIDVTDDDTENRIDRAKHANAVDHVDLRGPSIGDVLIENDSVKEENIFLVENNKQKPINIEAKLDEALIDENESVQDSKETDLQYVAEDNKDSREEKIRSLSKSDDNIEDNDFQATKSKDSVQETEIPLEAEEESWSYSPSENEADDIDIEECGKVGQNDEVSQEFEPILEDGVRGHTEALATDDKEENIELDEDLIEMTDLKEMDKLKDDSLLSSLEDDENSEDETDQDEEHEYDKDPEQHQVEENPYNEDQNVIHPQDKNQGVQHPQDEDKNVEHPNDEDQYVPYSHDENVDVEHPDDDDQDVEPLSDDDADVEHPDDENQNMKNLYDEDQDIDYPQNENQDVKMLHESVQAVEHPQDEDHDTESQYDDVEDVKNLLDESYHDVDEVDEVSQEDDYEEGEDVSTVFNKNITDSTEAANISTIKEKASIVKKDKVFENLKVSKPEDELSHDLAVIADDVPSTGNEDVFHSYHVEEKKSKIIQDSKYTPVSDGVKKYVLRNGYGDLPRKGDTITLHCKGYIDNDPPKMFWDTKELGQRMFSFTVGEKQVIKGWDQAAASMKLRERSKFKIEAKKAYGKFGFKAWDIPPDADLIMEFETMSIKRSRKRSPTSDKY